MARLPILTPGVRMTNKLGKNKLCDWIKQYLFIYPRITTTAISGMQITSCHFYFFIFPRWPENLNPSHGRDMEIGFS